MSSIQDYKDLRKIVSGDIIVKCRLGNDIRRIPINQAPSYDELCLMMYRLYKNELSSPDNIVLKYTDEEGDLISMTDDLDVSHAISQSSLLKITVFDKQMQPHISKNESALVTQLTEIRDKLNDILKAAETVAEKPKDDQEKQKTPEKTYRQLSTAEMAEFLEESQNGRNSMKQEERPKEASPLRQHPFISPPSQPQPQQQQQQPQAPMPQQTPTSAYPPPPPPISTAPSSAPPPQQHVRQPSYPAPPQQPSTPIQQGYPPVSAPMPPPPGTPQSSYTPAIRPPDYNAYRAQTPTAPPSSGQYYYPMPQQQPQQQQQQQHPPQPSLPQHQPVNTGRW